ncbi:hypothetical protein D1007_20655 [Hordeum vulgare]|nr:hypothetical protein D1007_20655 [Hordeum vulgare]
MRMSSSDGIAWPCLRQEQDQLLKFRRPKPPIYIAPVTLRQDRPCRRLCIAMALASISPCCEPISEPLRSERIRSTMLVCVLHIFILFPNRMSCKMTIYLDTITIIAMLGVSFLRYVSLPTTCLISLPTLS